VGADTWLFTVSCMWFYRVLDHLQGALDAVGVTFNVLGQTWCQHRPDGDGKVLETVPWWQDPGDVAVFCQVAAEAWAGGGLDDSPPDVDICSDYVEVGVIEPT